MANALHRALTSAAPRRRRLAASARGVVLALGDEAIDVPSRNVVSVAQADAATLSGAGLDAGAFDTVISAFFLCTVPEPGDALAEIRRILRPDGRLLFLEHVRGGGLRASLQQVVRPVWQRVVVGCHPDRDIVGAIRAAGFLVTDLERFSIRLAPVISPGVQGTAKMAA